MARPERAVSVQHRGNSLPIGGATLKHFNQMTEPKIIYFLLLHIIYTAHDALRRTVGGKGEDTPVLALLNLFALWREHAQKTERRKQKAENRNEKQALSVGHLAVPIRAAVSVAVAVVVAVAVGGTNRF